MSKKHFINFSLLTLLMCCVMFIACDKEETIPENPSNPSVVTPDPQPQAPVDPDIYPVNPTDTTNNYILCDIEGLKYLLNYPTDNIATFVGLSNKDVEEVIIPDDITWDGKTYPVTNISVRQEGYYGDGNKYEWREELAAINWGNKVKKVVIGNNVRQLPRLLFYNNISGFNLPSAWPFTPEETFFSELNVKEVVLGKNVEAIPIAFASNCKSLEQITMYYPKSIGNYAFSDCVNLKKIIYHDPETDEIVTPKDYTLQLPSTITYIKDNAFQATSFKKVDLRNCYLNFMGEEVFFQCMLSEVRLKAVKIGNIPFNTKKLYLYGNMTEISYCTLFGCDEVHCEGLLVVSKMSFEYMKEEFLQYLQTHKLYFPKYLEEDVMNEFQNIFPGSGIEIPKDNLIFTENPMD